MKQKITKIELDKKIRKIDLQIEKLNSRKDNLLNIKKIRRLYTTQEAISLMKRGKFMCMGEGHIHSAGYFYEYLNEKFIEHNGDGSIYRNDVDMNRRLDEYKKKKFWVIVTKKDFQVGYNIKWTQKH